MRGDTAFSGRFKMDDNDEQSVYTVMYAYLKYKSNFLNA